MTHRLHIFLLFFSIALTALAGRERGDSAFLRGDYAMARECYLEALKKSPDAATYYNLGVTCYRLHRPADAVIYFRHALRLQPGDPDTRYNMAFIETQLQDQFSQPSKMFFLRWLYGLRLTLSAATWAILALWCFAVCLASFVLYRLAFISGRSAAVTKSIFAVSALFLMLTLAFNVFAYKQYSESRECVAVVSKDTTLRDGPSATSRVLRTVHPGVTLTLTDGSGVGSHTAASLPVALPDGTTAWLADTTAVTFIGR